MKKQYLAFLKKKFEDYDHKYPVYAIISEKVIKAYRNEKLKIEKASHYHYSDGSGSLFLSKKDIKKMLKNAQEVEEVELKTLEKFNFDYIKMDVEEGLLFKNYKLFNED